MNEMTNDAAVAWYLKGRECAEGTFPYAFTKNPDDLKAISPTWTVEPLYSATTVAELSAEVERRKDAQAVMSQFAKVAEERADAAERRVAELEAGAKAVVLAFEALGQSHGIVADRAAHRQCEATLVTLKSLYTLRQEKPE